ncbi:UNVERIFIED_CONTAM: Retrovirus-related Pol polyprotein from transposon gypsy [Sesamum latifolium]|uniref:Retrovirus-related Pol polyprotein from transposon gypsy n=1 Tax=Sesamum latifolium TaxID=2727402 RepID=A0AAW2XW80_9LAMI
MAEEERVKTSFIIENGIYCYRVMPFGMKNVGAIYQRLVNRMFKEIIGKTMEVYVDNMLVKSIEQTQHLKHLEESFAIMRRYDMKLNPVNAPSGSEEENFSDTWSLRGE